MLFRNLSVFLIAICGSIGALEEPTPHKIKTLYNSLSLESVSQHLAFYDLYPNSPEGQQALTQAWILLAGKNASIPKQIISDPNFSSAIKAVVALVNKQPDEPIVELNERELIVIEQLGSRLSNRKLKGSKAKTEAEVLQLPLQQIDLARGLFLTQMGADNMRKIRSYEAQIDLMAMQILARMPENASAATKIRVMNDFVFGEMGFRFPPHSIYAKNIDVYTFLPSVLDSRRGVCLGVSILYLCLAQRLDLTLEMITPPGHIYVRYRGDGQEINIETTARGVNINSEEYLGIDTRSLQQRNIKEVIGLAHFNQASVYWAQEKYADARASYEKAEPYLPGDNLLKELMAYSYILTGSDTEGRAMLEQVKDYIPEHAVSKNNMAEDLLNGNVDTEGLKAIFLDVDETRESILEKQKALQIVLEKHPKFRSGLMALATTWLQLHRDGEGLGVLQRLHELDAEDPTVEYYLAVLYAQRFDYNRAWKHFRNVERIVKSRNHNPKALLDSRRELTALAPE